MTGSLMPIYLDYQSTTPCDARVVEKMLPFFTEHFGNAHAVAHPWGWQAEEAVELAREQLAKAINADTKEVIFTSGATEANNLAIKGVANFYQRERKHVITVATEHRCVLESCRSLERDGFLVTVLPVEKNGLIDIARLEDAIGSETILVSIMAVNNEIGVIQPLAEIGALCRRKDVLFHSDAAQALGKIAIDVKAMNIDLASFSAHKLYGPKGVGAIYIRRRPRIRLIPFFDGGGQEYGYRSGTLPVPLCVGMGEAVKIAVAGQEEENKKLQIIRDAFLVRLGEKLSDFTVNGDLQRRITGNLSLTFAHIEGEGLLRNLRDIAVSAGSSCNSTEKEPSHVLRALGLNSENARSSLRVGFGRNTPLHDALAAAESIATAVNFLRQENSL